MGNNEIFILIRQATSDQAARIVRAYETARRAEEDMLLLQDQTGASYITQTIEYIDN